MLFWFFGVFPEKGLATNCIEENEYQVDDIEEPILH